MQDWPFPEDAPAQLRHVNMLTAETRKLSLARFTSLRELTLNQLGPLDAAALPTGLLRLTLAVEAYLKRPECAADLPRDCTMVFSHVSSFCTPVLGAQSKRFW